MEEQFEKAVADIESAANGIAGAVMAGDMAYAQKRRTDIGFAAEVLRRNGAKVDVDSIITSADKMVEACRHRDMHSSFVHNVKIGEILAPLCE
jgi:hypothetical protein